MAAVDRDLVRLYRVLRILNEERQSPAFKIAELFSYVFESEELNHRALTLSPCNEWDDESLSRALHVIEEIVTQYVRFFYEPRELPVTHYKRQKRLAIHLDSIFKHVLRETVVRLGRDSLLEEDGSPARDVFLDEPILFLKQEARAKGFPKTKKGGGASLRALKERFETKLAAKGVPMLLKGA